MSLNPSDDLKWNFKIFFVPVCGTHLNNRCQNCDDGLSRLDEVEPTSIQGTTSKSSKVFSTVYWHMHSNRLVYRYQIETGWSNAAVRWVDPNLSKEAEHFWLDISSYCLLFMLKAFNVKLPDRLILEPNIRTHTYCHWGIRVLMSSLNSIQFILFNSRVKPMRGKCFKTKLY